MATLIINNKSKAAKLMLEYLKTQSYAKKSKSKDLKTYLLKSIENAEMGELVNVKIISELIDNRNM
jgi:hypothetical protein